MDKTKGKIRVKYDADGEEKQELITLAIDAGRLREASVAPKQSKEKTPTKKRKNADGEEAGGSTSKKAKVDQDADMTGAAGDDFQVLTGEQLVGKRVRILYDEDQWWEGQVVTYDADNEGGPYQVQRELSFDKHCTSMYLTQNVRRL